MQTKKMSLANITGKLSRAEMKNIMAGSGYATISCNNQVGTWYYTSMPNCATLVQDTNLYCRYGGTIAPGSQCRA